MTLREVIRKELKALVHRANVGLANYSKSEDLIIEAIKTSMPKKAEHLESCLCVIEPRYFGNPEKRKYCTCGATVVNEFIEEMLTILDNKEES